MHTALKYVCALSSCAVLALFITLLASSAAQTRQDKYTVKVPGGLAFSEFRGYEAWQAISISRNERWSL